jgi:hypothetical protein
MTVVFLLPTRTPRRQEDSSASCLGRPAGTTVVGVKVLETIRNLLLRGTGPGAREWRKKPPREVRELCRLSGPSSHALRVCIAL